MPPEEAHEGYNYDNIPGDVLAFCNERHIPSDMELRNPQHLERPTDPLCDLCGRVTPFFRTCERCAAEGIERTILSDGTDCPRSASGGEEEESSNEERAVTRDPHELRAHAITFTRVGVVTLFVPQLTRAGLGETCAGIIHDPRMLKDMASDSGAATTTTTKTNAWWRLLQSMDPSHGVGSLSAE